MRNRPYSMLAAMTAASLFGRRARDQHGEVSVDDLDETRPSGDSGPRPVEGPGPGPGGEDPMAAFDASVPSAAGGGEGFTIGSADSSTPEAAGASADSTQPAETVNANRLLDDEQIELLRLRQDSVEPTPHPVRPHELWHPTVEVGRAVTTPMARATAGGLPHIPGVGTDEEPAGYRGRVAPVIGRLREVRSSGAGESGGILPRERSRGPLGSGEPPRVPGEGGGNDLVREPVGRSREMGGRGIRGVLPVLGMTPHDLDHEWIRGSVEPTAGADGSYAPVQVTPEPIPGASPEPNADPSEAPFDGTDEGDLFDVDAPAPSMAAEPAPSSGAEDAPRSALPSDGSWTEREPAARHERSRGSAALAQPLDVEPAGGAWAPAEQMAAESKASEPERSRTLSLVPGVGPSDPELESSIVDADDLDDEGEADPRSNVFALPNGFVDETAAAPEVPDEYLAVRPLWIEADGMVPTGGILRVAEPTSTSASEVDGEVRVDLGDGWCWVNSGPEDATVVIGFDGADEILTAPPSTTALAAIDDDGARLLAVLHGEAILTHESGRMRLRPGALVLLVDGEEPQVDIASDSELRSDPVVARNLELDAALP